MKRTRRIVYWCAECSHDSTAFSFRARTKREVLQALKQSNLVFDPEADDGDGGYTDKDQNADPNPRMYKRPRKVVIEYETVAALAMEIQSEGWYEGYWMEG